MCRRVAADASTLIGLATAGQFELLQRVFGTVDVTGAVRDEVGARKSLPGAAELESAVEGGWVSIVPVEADPIFADLGAGRWGGNHVDVRAGRASTDLDRRSGCAVVCKGKWSDSHGHRWCVDSSEKARFRGGDSAFD